MSSQAYIGQSLSSGHVNGEYQWLITDESANSINTELLNESHPTTDLKAGNPSRITQLEKQLSIERSIVSHLVEETNTLHRTNVDLRKKLSISQDNAADKQADQLGYAVEVAAGLEKVSEAKTMTVWKLLSAIEGTVDGEAFLAILQKATGGKKGAYSSDELLRLLSEGPPK